MRQVLVDKVQVITLRLILNKAEFIVYNVHFTYFFIQERNQQTILKLFLLPSPVAAFPTKQ